MLGLMSPRAARYPVAAVLLGVLWFFALRLAPSTQGFLAGGDWGRGQAIRSYELLPLMCLASLGVALLFRSWIVGARTLARRLLLATLLPFAGCVLFICLTITYVLVTGRLASSTGHFVGDLIELPFMMFFMALYGMLYAAMAYYVILPVGVVSQLLMERIGRDVGSQSGQAI